MCWLSARQKHWVHVLSADTDRHDWNNRVWGGEMGFWSVSTLFKYHKGLMPPSTPPVFYWCAVSYGSCVCVQEDVGQLVPVISSWCVSNRFYCCTVRQSQPCTLYKKAKGELMWAHNTIVLFPIHNVLILKWNSYWGCSSKAISLWLLLYFFSLFVKADCRSHFGLCSPPQGHYRTQLWVGSIPVRSVCVSCVCACPVSGFPPAMQHGCCPFRERVMHLNE